MLCVSGLDKGREERKSSPWKFQKRRTRFDRARNDEERRERRKEPLAYRSPSRCRSLTLRESAPLAYEVIPASARRHSSEPPSKPRGAGPGVSQIQQSNFDRMAMEIKEESFVRIEKKVSVEGGGSSEAIRRSRRQNEDIKEALEEDSNYRLREGAPEEEEEEEELELEEYQGTNA